MGSARALISHFGSLPYSALKYFQNETNPRLLNQSVWELSRKQGELFKNEGPPPFLGGGSVSVKNWFNGHETWQISIWPGI